MKASDEYFELAGSPSTTQQRENTIEVSLRGVEQFFNTIDPSRFHEKDLDHDLEEFIVSWATEYPLNEPIRLVVHLQMILPDTDTHAVIERAVHNYFAYKTDLNLREFRNLLREGRISLVIGLSFLALCFERRRSPRRSRTAWYKGAAGEFDDLRLGGDVASDGDLPLPVVAVAT